MSVKSRLDKLETVMKPKTKLVFTFNKDDVDESDNNTIYVYFNLED